MATIRAAKPKIRVTGDDRLRAAVALGNHESGLTHWWAEHVIAKVDHDAVVEAVRDDAGWSAHFAFMTLMSAGIAILGLLLPSPAVVIGAMLISPLMGPIIGIGFALATFDSVEIRRNLRAILIGTVLAVLFCAMIVAVSPLQTVTSEIASRTRPNLFDLLIAMLSGLAATYAMVRGRHGAIVGVAIATALMPPIAVMGFGLATANWRVFSGSFLLFFTNFMMIAAATAVLARLYGFATDLSPRQTKLQATLLLVSLLVLAVPLGIALKNIAWEALAAREAKAAIADAFGPNARVTDVVLDFDRKPMGVQATVLTPSYSKQAEATISERLGRELGRNVDLSIDQLRTANGSADASTLAASNAAQVDRIAGRAALELASVAGVEPNNVLVDRGRKVVQARAKPLPGATLATYRAIEQRIADSEPGWTIELIPPLLDLPQIHSVPDPAKLDTTANPEIVLAGWAGARTGVPITVRGRKDASARVVAALKAAGAVAEGGAGDANPPTLHWQTAPAAP